jgi:hypothetical protein
MSDALLKARRRRYEQSPKGVARRLRYEHSDKGRQRQLAYYWKPGMNAGRFVRRRRDLRVLRARYEVRLAELQEYITALYRDAGVTPPNA